MKIKINKYKLAIRLMVVAGPILDLMTGYYQLVLGSTSRLTPGVLYRGMILIPIFFILILKLKTDYFRVVIGYFIFVFAIGIGIHVLSGYDVEIVDHTQRFLKMLFPILGFGAIMYLEHRFCGNGSGGFLWKVAGQYGLIVAISVVLFFLSGKGLATYRHGFSSIAFFDGQNSMGFILAVSLASLLHYLNAYKRSSILLILSVEGLFLLSAFLIGTRTAIIFVPITIVLFHGTVFFQTFSKGKVAWAVYSLILLISIGFIGLWIYRFWSSQYNVAYIQEKFQVLVRGGTLSYGTRHLRARVPDGIETIRGFGILQHLFGIGDVAFDLTENDLVDIYGKFGLLTLVPLIVFLSYYYIRILRVFITTRTIASLVLVFSFLLYILQAALAGHALLTAQANNLFMLLYYLGYREVGLLQRKRAELRG